METLTKHEILDIGSYFKQFYWNRILEIKEENSSGRFILDFYIQPIKDQYFAVEIFYSFLGGTYNFKAENIPGVFEEGENLENSFLNFIYSLIQAVDARVKKGIPILSQVYATSRYMGVGSKEISLPNLVSFLNDNGYKKEYEGPFHTIYFGSDSRHINLEQNYGLFNSAYFGANPRISFSVPNKEIISPWMNGNYKQYQYMVGYSLAKKLHLLRDFPENYWACEKCGGNSYIGCHLIDFKLCTNNRFSRFAK